MPKINLGKVVGEKGDPFTYEDFTQAQLERITPKLLKGNVTTLNPDENATVNIRKEGLNNYIDFGIPRGMNGSEIKSISATNVEMADGTTVSENIDNLNTPTFDDSTGTYTTLTAANTAAETASNAIRSKVSIFTTLSNMKKSFSAIIQGLKILGTNVGMITGITSDLNSESDTIAASSKAIATLNSNLGRFGIISASQNVDLAADELKIVGLTHQTVPKDAVIASAMVSVNNTFMQATLRNVTNSAANIMVKNHKLGANSGTVYFTVFYMPASDERLT